MIGHRSLIGVLVAAFATVSVFIPRPALAVVINKNYGNLTPAQKALVDVVVTSWLGKLKNKEGKLTLTFSYEAISPFEDFEGSEPLWPEEPGAALANGPLGVTTGFLVDANNKPMTCLIRINSKYRWWEGIDLPDGDPPQWPNPNSYDMYTVLKHEVCHALGFSVAYVKFANNVANGPGANRTYNPGGNPTAILVPAAQQTHTHPLVHVGDLMNPAVPKCTRRQKSALDAAILNHGIWNPFKILCGPDNPFPCDQTWPIPGCNSPSCCNYVCPTLPFCCSVAWDQSCVDAALASGCVTKELCDDEAHCQVYGALKAFVSTKHPGFADEALVADDFSPVTSGSISQICWQGAYSPNVLPVDSFEVRYYLGNDKLPGPVIAAFSQAAGTLQNVLRNNTGAILPEGSSVSQYTATHAPVPLVAGGCYWIQINNNLPQGLTWSWAAAGRPPVVASYQGNGRSLQDGTPPDGYGTEDLLVDEDLGFCLGINLGQPACGFRTLFDTGAHEMVLVNGATAEDGWASGNLSPASPQARTAQAFTLPALPADQAWKIDQIAVEGFDPGGGVNDFINFEIWTRSALNVPPTPATSVAQIFNVFFDPAINVDPISARVFLVFSGSLVLAPGNYWLTMFASNALGPGTPANFAWYTNAPNGINNFCPLGAGCGGNPGCQGAPNGSPAMWRSCSYPVPGFQGFQLAQAVLGVDPVNDPTPDPNDLYNTAFLIRGQAIEVSLCPWDCGGVPDGNVAIVDFLALLGQWNIVGAPCDFDGGGVNVVDFLKLLGNWGPCP